MRWLRQALACLLAGCTVAAAHVPAHASAPMPRALIVAVSSFESPELAPFALAGAEQDARRMEQAFSGFAGPEARQTLLEGKDATLARTREELARLAEGARPGERIMLYFSAHGTRIPDSGMIDEADGQDEVLLLADAGEWDGQHLPGGLTDDALGDAVRAIRVRGADVFLVIDSCASGGAARSGPALQLRSLPSASLGIPAVQSPRLLRSALRSERQWVEDDMPPGSGRLVVFAASPSDAAAWDSPDGGLFTTSLAEALAGNPEDFVTLGSTQQRLQASGPLPGPPSELSGAIESAFFFTGSAPDLLQRSAKLPRPDWSLELYAASQDRCIGGTASVPRALDPNAITFLRHCDAVMLAVTSMRAGRFDAWYLDSAGQRTLLSPVSGVYLDGRSPSQLSFTFVTRDPETGQSYPAGTEHLLLFRRGGSGTHDGAMDIAFGIAGPD